MKKRTPISKIMTEDIITVNKTQSIKEVSDIIKDKNIRHVPVVSGEKIIGMLSKVDLQKISFVNTVDGDDLTTALYDGLNIKQVMTKDVKVAQKSDTIYEVASILSKNEFHSLPVVEQDKLVGIVTTTDLIKYLVDQY
jgi:CBS domain-containing protein